MDKPISVGDLVIIVRHDHACADVLLGKVFSVAAVVPFGPGFRCPHCGGRDMHIGSAAAQWAGFKGDRQGGAWVPVAWLKRIDELPEEETEKHDEEITA